MSKSSFEDWHVAGRQYAKDHPELDLWEFQVKTMASDFAWRMEGAEITPESVERAYQDWISGNNPYSVHTIGYSREEFGYDIDEQRRRWKTKATEEYREYGALAGIDPRNLDRFISGLYIELFFYKDKAECAVKEWNSGLNKKSPYHIPFDSTHLMDRYERKFALREQFPLLGEGWQSDIHLGDRLTMSRGFYKFYEMHHVRKIPLDEMREEDFED